MGGKCCRCFENYGISFEHMPSGIDTMTIFVHQSEFEEYEQSVIAGIHRAVEPDFVEMESDLALIAVVGRGMKATRGTAGRIFSALAHARVNVKMIDQGSSELKHHHRREKRGFLSRPLRQFMISSSRRSCKAGGTKKTGKSRRKWRFRLSFYHGRYKTEPLPDRFSSIWQRLL